MKLLLDQNISFRITNKIQDLFPGSKQVRDLGLENTKDSFIWNYAKENNYDLAFKTLLQIISQEIEMK